MFPMPRTSRRMSDGRMCRAGSPRSAGADPIAISRSPECAAISTVTRGGAYTAWGGPSKGDARSPTCGQPTSPMRTAHRPAITTMHASDPSVSSSNRPPFGMRSALKLTYRQPADAGVTETPPFWARTRSELIANARGASSQVPPLFLLSLLVALARIADGPGLRRRRDGDFPPAFVARHGDIVVDLDVDHHS